MNFDFITDSATPDLVAVAENKGSGKYLVEFTAPLESTSRILILNHEYEAKKGKIFFV